MADMAMLKDRDTSTNWLIVFCALFAGVSAALQIGKASALLGILGEHFDVGLTDTAMYLSLFSLGAALFGTLVGVVSARVQPLRAGLVGLVLIGLGSLFASFAQSWGILLFARVIEAFGMPLVVCTMPALIQANTSATKRVVAMGFWATWLPLGIAIALGLSLIGDWAVDWRLLMRICAVFPLFAAVVLAAVYKKSGMHPLAASPVVLTNITMAMLAVASLFAMFSASYLTVQGFIPSIAIESWSFATGSANLIGAGSAMLVIAGNLAASFLMAKNVPVSKIYIISMGVMALAAAILFTGALPVGLRIFAALVFTFCAGFPPAAIWALVPRLSLSTGVGASLVSGVVYQGAGIGQLAGPILAGYAVDFGGSWSGATFVTATCAAIGITISILTFRQNPELLK